MRLLLLPFSLIFGCIVALRNSFYRVGILKSSEFNLPVIVVGNLSVGGTGKSPHTIWLAEKLSQEFTTAHLSRGYGRRTSGYLKVETDSPPLQTGDEPLQFKRRFPQLLTGVDEKRVRGILHILTEQPETELLLLDDAFQHRSLKPGFSLLLSDFQQPFYNDFLLPAGNLREFRNGAGRADVIIITKCPESISEEDKLKIKNEISVFSNAPVFFSSLHYSETLIHVRGKESTSEKEDKWLLVTGIANPIPLEEKLKNENRWAGSLHFGDHHRFTAKDLEKIKTTWDGLEKKPRGILTTEKDAVRFLGMSENEYRILEHIPLFFQPISITLDREEELLSKIRNYVRETLRDYRIHQLKDQEQA